MTYMKQTKKMQQTVRSVWSEKETVTVLKWIISLSITSYSGGLVLSAGQGQNSWKELQGVQKFCVHLYVDIVPVKMF